MGGHEAGPQQALILRRGGWQDGVHIYPCFIQLLVDGKGSDGVIGEDRDDGRLGKPDLDPGL